MLVAQTNYSSTSGYFTLYFITLCGVSLNISQVVVTGLLSEQCLNIIMREQYCWTNNQWRRQAFQTGGGTRKNKRQKNGTTLLHSECNIVYTYSFTLKSQN